MSAIAAVIDGPTAHLFADGAFYDDDGVLLGIGNKLWPIPNVGVVTGRGAGAVIPLALLAAARVEASDWDDFKSKIVDVFWRFDATLAVCRPDNQVSEIMFAGWSVVEGRQEVFYRTTGDLYADAGFEPWKIYELGEGPTSFGIDAEQWPWDGASGFDAAGAVAAFEVARRSTWPTKSGADAHFIGGHVDHAVVNADGVTVQRLHTWSDRLFEKIDPVHLN